MIWPQSSDELGISWGRFTSNLTNRLFKKIPSFFKGIFYDSKEGSGTFPLTSIWNLHCIIFQLLLIFSLSYKLVFFCSRYKHLWAENRSSYTKALRYSLSSPHFEVRRSVSQSRETHSLADWVILILPINKHNKYFPFQPWSSHTNELIKPACFTLVGLIFYSFLPVIIFKLQPIVWLEMLMSPHVELEISVC